MAAPARDIVCLNAGAAIYVAGCADSLAAGVEAVATGDLDGDGRLDFVATVIPVDARNTIRALGGAVTVRDTAFSVKWSSSLHQGQTVVKGAMDPEMLIPLLINIAGFTFLFGALLLRRIRTEVLYRERRKKWVKELVLAAEGRS